MELRRYFLCKKQLNLKIKGVTQRSKNASVNKDKLIFFIISIEEVPKIFKQA